MLVTLSGMVILVRLLQLEKALYPMLVTLFGMVILVRLLQLSKAESLMLVTLSGMVMLVRLLKLEKAEYPMLRTGFPLTVPGMVTAPDAFPAPDRMTKWVNSM